jgi:hypothetical protein
MTIKLSDFGFAKELKEGETLTGKYTCAYTNPDRKIKFCFPVSNIQNHCSGATRTKCIV